MKLKATSSLVNPIFRIMQEREREKESEEDKKKYSWLQFAKIGYRNTLSDSKTLN